MKRQNNDVPSQSEKFSWFDCIGDIQDQSDPLINLNSEQRFYDQDEHKIKISLDQSTNRLQYPLYLSTRQQPTLDYLKQQTLTHITQEDMSSSNEQNYHRSNKSRKNSQNNNQQHKHDRQLVYSKNYRQRKKQQYKLLEQENDYLKKRINELQYRLREQEIQLNRFKYPPLEKQVTVEQFRREFVQMNVQKLNQHKKDPFLQTKTVYTPNDPFYYEFLDMYQLRGFAGTKKLKLLQYHFQQILESMLLDSQRYLILVIANSKTPEKLMPLQQYQPINNAFKEVFKLNQQLNPRLQHFVDNLHPMLMEFTQNCSEFYKAYQKMQSGLKKIHNFLKQTYLTNMDVARKRIELETWFQFHKYGKLMRRLRSQWLSLIRQGAQNLQKGKKKDKLNKKQKK